MSLIDTALITRRGVGAVLLLGAMAGAALGQNVTIPWPTVTYKGSVEMAANVRAGQCIPLYLVPSGVKLRVTSFLLDAQGGQSPVPLQFICSGFNNCTTDHTHYMTAPAGATLPVSLTSGFLINSGETVYACSDANFGTVGFMIYGFIYR